MEATTSGKSCPALKKPVCQSLQVLCHPGDGQIGDCHIPDKAWADPIAVEVQLLLASKKGLINLLEHRFQLYQECISLISSGV